MNVTPQAAGALPAGLVVVPDTIRHILLGRPGSIRQTIHLLHNLNYSDASQWSPLIEIPDGQLILTPERGEVLSLLMKRL